MSEDCEADRLVKELFFFILLYVVDWKDSVSWKYDHRNNKGKLPSYTDGSVC